MAASHRTAYKAAIALLAREGVPKDNAQQIARQIGAVVGAMPAHDLAGLVDRALPSDAVAHDIRATLVRPAPSRPVIAAAVTAAAVAIVSNRGGGQPAR